jgi:hypothetical protein
VDDEQRALIRSLADIRRPHQDEAHSLSDLHRRADVARLLAQGETPVRVSRMLGISETQVRQSYEVSLQKLRDRAAREEHERRFPKERTAAWARKRKGTPPFMIRREQKRAYQQGLRMTPPDELAPVRVPPRVSGTVIESPDVLYYRKEAFKLRKRALPYDLIAERLGITTDEAVGYVRDEIKRLDQDETKDIEVARKLHLEQLDAMISAIYGAATGTWDDGTPREVKYEAIDRMVKLLDAKAKLLGLNAPQKIDIDTRLVIMAEQMDADLDDLREIAVEVLQQYQPGLRSGR